MISRFFRSLTSYNKEAIVFPILMLLLASTRSNDLRTGVAFPHYSLDEGLIKDLWQIAELTTFPLNLPASAPVPVAPSLFTNTHKEYNEDFHYTATGCSVNQIRFFMCPVEKLTRETVGEDRILDFWGEGRIVDGDLITGFPDSYNVNHQDQKVSNGDMRGFSIPNRIPTVDYDNVDVSALIADSTFRYVTTMGSKLIPDAAKEMYRIARKDNDARIIFYGDETDITDRIQAASQDDFAFAQHSSQYVDSLASKLLIPTLRPINVMVPINQLLSDLDVHLQNRDNDVAARILQDLQAYCMNGYSQTIRITKRLSRLYEEYGPISTNENSTSAARRITR